MEANQLENKIEEGFKTLNEAVSSLSSLTAVLVERVDNIRSDQAELKEAMKDLEETKKEVEKNSQFRRDVLRVFWLAVGVLVTAGITALFLP